MSEKNEMIPFWSARAFFIGAVWFVMGMLNGASLHNIIGPKPEKCHHVFYKRVRCFKPTDDEEPQHDHWTFVPVREKRNG